ncbi:hypothetical protein DVK44_12535 [Streptomyces paludis]|uniref:Uncharacterized protein n=1 Tax=Streptomyces paludis TaxID=2282738 RepID=A0A345HNX7_9ACTN|nr:hypothetical protein DVK44_12535 [Streptomyces paludis]
MHSDSALENRSAPRGRRRRKRGTGHREGPVFVDTSGRRSRLLRRAGVVFGIVCIGYVAVLGLAFMGGISLTPSEISPFNGGPAAAEGGGGGGGAGNVPPGEGAPPSGMPSGAPSPAASTASGN